MLVCTLAVTEAGHEAWLQAQNSADEIQPESDPLLKSADEIQPESDPLLMTDGEERM